MARGKQIYRRFLDRELRLKEAAAVLRARATAGNAHAGALALDGLALDVLTEEERERVAKLLNEVIQPLYRAFVSGEVSVEATARQLAPFIPPHSFFGLDDSMPDGSSWSAETLARFGELFHRLAEASAESGADLETQE